MMFTMEEEHEVGIFGDHYLNLNFSNIQYSFLSSSYEDRWNMRSYRRFHDKEYLLFIRHEVSTKSCIWT